jgi:hypothetical protein
MLASTKSSGTSSEITPMVSTPISSKITDARAIVFQAGEDFASETVARTYTKALRSDNE